MTFPVLRKLPSPLLFALCPFPFLEEDHKVTKPPGSSASPILKAGPRFLPLLLALFPLKGLGALERDPPEKCAREKSKPGGLR